MVRNAHEHAADDSAEYVTIKAAAAANAVSEQTIRRLIDAGKLPAYRLRGTPIIRLRRADVAALWSQAK